jgi:hypothetical protein
MYRGQWVKENLICCIKDPISGELYMGWSHSACIMKAPINKHELLLKEYDDGSCNVGFIYNDKFVTRDIMDQIMRDALREL